MTARLRFAICLLFIAMPLWAQSDAASLRSKAESGDPQAQDLLGTRLRSGIDGPKDFAEAMRWYRAAAKQGLPQAMFNIGTMYYNGDGLASDLREAYAWFLLGSAAGDRLASEAVARTESEVPLKKVDALTRAAEILQKGDDVPKNLAKAAEFMKMAADTGDAPAATRYALLLIQGQGAPKDLASAQRYCAQGAKKAYAPAMSCLGYLCEDPELGPPRYKEALKWYEAAESGADPIGAYGVGRIYALGLGVKPDLLKAIQYPGLWPPAATAFLISDFPLVRKLEAGK